MTGFYCCRFCENIFQTIRAKNKHEEGHNDHTLQKEQRDVGSSLQRRTTLGQDRRSGTA
jgi:hypothetical protein